MIATWGTLPSIDAGVLLVVNSAPTQIDEIERVLGALEQAIGLDRVSVMAPVPLRSWLVRRGVEASRVLASRLSGLPVELGFFLESDRAIRWAASVKADVIVCSEPYALRNEEVKAQFERRIAPMMAGRRYLAHSLPSSQVFLWTAEDLYARASRPLRLARYRVLAREAMDALHDQWRTQHDAGTVPSSSTEETVLALFTAPFVPETSSDIEAATDLRRDADARRLAAMDASSVDPSITAELVVTDPADAVGRAPAMAGRVAAVRRPAQVALGLKRRGTRLAMRGRVEGPYSYLLTSRPVTLRPGDAAVARGRVYRGGVTIGLVKDGRWAAKVDIDEPGRFLAAAVAAEAGAHTLVVANCLKGGDTDNAFALSTVGWARQD